MRSKSVHLFWGPREAPPPPEVRFNKFTLD